MSAARRIINFGVIGCGLIGQEFAILQMWAAFCDELANGLEGMRQPFYCATPEEARWSHALFTAALHSQARREIIRLAWPA